jgi:hypothetical protein
VKQTTILAQSCNMKVCSATHKHSCRCQLSWRCTKNRVYVSVSQQRIVNEVSRWLHSLGLYMCFLADCACSSESCCSSAAFLGAMDTFHLPKLQFIGMPLVVNSLHRWSLLPSACLNFDLSMPLVAVPSHQWCLRPQWDAIAFCCQLNVSI